MRPEALADALEEARQAIIASGFLAFPGPDPLMRELIDAMALPASVLIVETRALDPDEPVDLGDTPQNERRIDSPSVI